MATWDSLRATYGNAIIDVLPPWMAESPELASGYLYEMIDVQGDTALAADNALETIRNAPQYQTLYDSIFTGNRRPDGTLRLEEGAYLSRKQSYRDALLSVSPNMDPSIFEEEYSQLIEGDVDATEFGRRVSALNSRVLINSPFIRDYYAENFGVNMTDEGVLASLMSGRLNDEILNKTITMAEIGGEASMQNFDITTEFVEMLASEGGMDREEANRLFGSAAALLPTLGALARRHGDSDDTFDITEFARGTSAIADVEQIQRINRLKAQEQSLFTGGSELEYERSRATGGISGLQES